MTAEVSKQDRKAVLIRAWFSCERCARTDGLQLHHRRPRQAGGTTDPAATTAANALVLCAACHRWVESNREAATVRGWLVPQGVDPADVPVLIYGRGRVLLGLDGQYHPKKGTRI